MHIKSTTLFVNELLNSLIIYEIFIYICIDFLYNTAWTKGKEGDTHNMNEPENLHLSQEAVAQKHFLTLHFSHKGQQKTIHLRIRHALAFCAATAIVLSSAVVSAGAYQKTKAELVLSEQQLLETERTNRKLEQRSEILQNENEQYNQNIEEIQNKTTELEQKMNELETVKDSLHDQINIINTDDTSADSSSAEVCSAMADALKNPVVATPKFTNIVTTSYNRAASLSTQLDRMNLLMDETGVSFHAVAQDVTQTLAAYSNIPNGKPIDSDLISTEFNPTGDPAISDGRTHKGIDISTAHRIIPVMATAAGTVVTSKFHDGYGNYVVIDHGNGFTTLYAHNSELLVTEGDWVKKGEVIAMTGSTGMSTGIHCHYEIQLNGVYQNPRDYF